MHSFDARFARRRSSIARTALFLRMVCRLKRISHLLPHSSSIASSVVSRPGMPLHLLHSTYRQDCRDHEAPRDLFSAYLAKHCSKNTLDIRQAEAAWPAAEPLLQRAMSRITETASRGPVPASFGISRRQSCSPVGDGSTTIEVVDAVAREGEGHKEMVGFAVRTPCL